MSDRLTWRLDGDDLDRHRTAVTFPEPVDIDAGPRARIHDIYDLLWISGGWWTATNIGDRVGLCRATVAALCSRHPEAVEKRTADINGGSVVEYRARRR